MTTVTVPDLRLAPVGTRTLRGDRSYQQDAYDWARTVDPDTGLPVIVAAVADGCGSGAGSGRIARAAVGLAVQVAACYGREHLDRAIDTARELVDGRSPRRGRNDNSTLVLAYYDAASLRVAWVGDSRAYALTADGELHRLTEDHNLGKYGYPNVLTRCLLGSLDHRHGDALEGCESHTPQLAAPLLGAPFHTITRVLLCTDGVSGPLTDGEIAGTLSTVSEPPYPHARRLASRAVRAARAAGEKADNATALVIDLGGVA